MDVICFRRSWMSSVSEGHGFHVSGDQGYHLFSDVRVVIWSLR